MLGFTEGFFISCVALAAAVLFLLVIYKLLDVLVSWVKFPK